MLGELPQPVLHVAERLAVRRQDQRVGMQHVEKRLAGLQERADRVELRFDMPGADIGGDARQDLVAGDQDLPLGAVERHVLRRMAFADDDAPAVLADRRRNRRRAGACGSSAASRRRCRARRPAGTAANFATATSPRSNRRKAARRATQVAHRRGRVLRQFANELGRRLGGLLQPGAILVDVFQPQRVVDNHRDGQRRPFLAAQARALERRPRRAIAKPATSRHRSASSNQCRNCIRRRFDSRRFWTNRRAGNTISRACRRITRCSTIGTATSAVPASNIGVRNPMGGEPKNRGLRG